MRERNYIDFDGTTLSFHKGTNTTIRRFGGGYCPGPCRIFSSIEEKNTKFLYDGDITNIHIFKFEDIPDQLLEIHHLGNFKEEFFGWPKRLNKIMQKHYKDFHPSEIVQVISFVVHFNGLSELPF